MNKDARGTTKPQQIKNNQVMVRLFFLVFGLTAFMACQKKAVSTAFESGSNFKYLDTKFKINYQAENQQSNAKVKLRMRQDSLLWAAITGPLNIEGIRAKISKDSIYIIDRINKKYIASDFDTLTRLLKFDVDYRLLESLILGDMPIYSYQSNQVSTEGKLLKIRQEKEGIEIFNYVNTRIGKLEKLQLLDMANGNQLEMTFLNYKKKQGYWFPQKGLIKVTYKDKNTQQILQTEVKIEHIKTTLGNKPVAFPFSVPAKYRE